METDVPDDVSVAKTLDLPPDAIDLSSDEEEPPPLARTGPTTAVGGIPIDTQRGNDSEPHRLRTTLPTRSSRCCTTVATSL
eukprot:COSAG02_NODE_8844_length_2422_cov_256.492467_3_plen_81_part_00